MSKRKNIQLAETDWAIGQFYCIIEANTVFHFVLPDTSEILKTGFC